MARLGESVQRTMASKEKVYLLPTSFDTEKDTKVKNGEYFTIRSVFGWLHIVATTLMFFWLVILPLCGSRPETHPVLPKDLIHELMNSQEVGRSSFEKSSIIFSLSRFGERGSLWL